MVAFPPNKEKVSLHDISPSALGAAQPKPEGCVEFL